MKGTAHLLIVTNTPRFPLTWVAAHGQSGESAIARNPGEYFAAASAHQEALLLVDCDPALAFRLAAASLFTGRAQAPLVSLDLVLRRPDTAAARAALPAKRFLLQRFALHLHYFSDFRGIDEVFGIGRTSAFVPFKPNLQFRAPAPAPEGEYVLCFGRSLRDYDTFFDAVERLPYPAAIAEPNVAELRAHGARFNRPLDRLPANVRILPDDNTADAQIRILSAARLLVLPILRKTLVASGISTCLNAMLLGKCVLGSEGPGMSDIFSEEVLTAPAEDPAALAALIQRAWEDGALRSRTAAAGYRYATALGGEADLYQRIIDRVCDRFGTPRR